MTAFVPRSGLFSDFLIELDREGTAGARSPRPDGCLFLSGMMTLDGEVVTDASRLTEILRRDDLSAARLADVPGQFVAVVRFGDRIFVCNDLLGLEHIYLLDTGSHRVVSNRLAAIVQFMKDRGVARRLRRGAVVAGLGLDHTFFRQIHSHDLAIEGVTLVPVDRYLELDGRRVVSHAKPALERALHRGGSEPEAALLDQGAAEVAETIEAILASPRFDGSLVTLSGGYDSRMTFAGVYKTGLLDRVPVLTHDVPGSDDLEIALRIAELTGAHYFEGEDVPSHWISPDLKLTLWRSFFMGLYHVMNAQCQVPLAVERPLARLTGGCGEVYSTFWLNSFQRFLDDGRATEADHLFSSLPGVPNLPAPLRESARESFARSVEPLPGDTLAEKLENHYLFFRNRVHFGQKGWQCFAGTLPMSPLVSASLLEVSRRHSIEERVRQILVFEVTSRLSPLLAMVEYNGGVRWPRSLLRRIPSRWHLKRRIARADGEAKRAEWMAAQVRQRARRTALGGPRRNLAPPTHPPDFFLFLRRRVDECIEVIRQSDPDLCDVLSAERWFQRIGEGSPRPALSFASKVFAVYDACFDDDRRSLVVGDLPGRETYADDPLLGVSRLRIDAAEATPVPERISRSETS